MIKTCPDDDVLRGLLDSSLPEPVQDEVVSHLDSCTSCQHKLEQIAAGGTSMLQVAKAAKSTDEPDRTSAFWPALQRVEDDVRSSGVAVLATRTDPERRSGTALVNDFNFLEAAEDSQYLGQIERFMIAELVGRGGMGMVFRAFDACLERTVAVKVLDPQYSRNPQARDRFHREARAAAGVTHENVVTIHHVGCIEDRDLSFMVMQYIRGRSLQERLDEGGPLPIRESVRIAAAAASGLAAAHANNLIHRDIKPGNILLEQSTGRVLITDFGLARMAEDVKLTQTGFVAGTPLYMSPEQARGEAVDHRSDLFSLGSVLYAMLTGVPPFPGTSPFTVLKHVTDRPPRPVQSLNPAVSNNLADVVDRLLQKNPRDRFTDANEATIALENELLRLPPESPRTLSACAKSSRIARRVRSWWRRRSSPIALGLFAVLVGLLFVSEAARLTRWTVIGQRGEEASTASNDTPTTEAPAVVEADTPTRYTLPPGDGAIWSIAFDPCGELMATATEGGTVQLWDPNEGHIRGTLNQKSKSPVWSIAFSKDGSRLATASDDGFVRLWDVKSKQEIGMSFKHDFPVRSVALSPDGNKLVSGTRKGNVIIWDIETGEQIKKTDGHDGGTVNAVAFSPDGKLIASAGSDKVIKLWDAEDGSPRTTLTNHTGPVYSVAFDPTSQFIVSAGWDHTIRLWDANTGEQLKVFDVHQDDVWSLAFCPAGKHLLTGGQDGTSRWIDLESGTVKRVYRARGGPVHAVAVSKDGSLVAIGSRDGAVRVWDVER
jgi:WD40 repeat protein